jgi:hypothetical protein
MDYIGIYNNYRRRRELGYSGYPLKPYPKPQNRRYNTPKYLLRATPNFLIGAPLIKRELEKLRFKIRNFKTKTLFSCVPKD